MNARLNNKVIVVTGGAGLIGSSYCKAIAEHGGVAIIAETNVDAAQSLASEIFKAGGKAEAAEMDITNEESISTLIDKLHNTHGNIHAVINNAYPRNKNYGQKLEDVSYKDFTENTSLHLGGYFIVAKLFAQYFAKHDGGNIINMASIYGCIAPRFELYDGTNMTTPVEYAAIKSAVIHLTQYFAQYFKGNNIRCNSISPGGIFDHQAESFLNNYNNKCASKGMLDVQDLLGSLIFLLSDESKFINGQNIVIDDGFIL